MISRIAKLILSKKGYQLKNIKIENFRDRDISPLEALYKAQGNRLLLKIPIEKCRTQIWNTLEPNKNPFVRTLISYSRGEIDGYLKSPLEVYYKDFQPKNAAAVLKLEMSSPLKEIEPLGFVFPWDNKNSLEAKEIRKHDAKRENKANDKYIDISHGYTEFGPVSIEKGNIEYKRLMNVYNSIKKKGYIESPTYNDGAISGYFVSDKRDYCFIITSGKHRSYALSALGYKDIPIVVNLDFNSIRYESESIYWLNVANSLFSLSDVKTFIRNIIYLPFQYNN